MPDPALNRINLIQVSDLADPRLAEYADLRDADLQARGGLFIAEGELVVRQLVTSRYRIRSLLLTPARLAAARDLLELLPPATPVFVAPQHAMNTLVGFNIHRGILAAAERGEPPSLAEVLSRAGSLVVLEDLANHDNVGGIFRAVAALAGPAAAVLLSPRCADPLYRKAIRVSVGHVLHTPFARAGAWPDALSQVRAAGFTLLALTPESDATPIGDVSVGAIRRPALLLGAEGPGLTAAALGAADIRVRIPIVPGVDSLNVTTAAAIALHRLISNPSARLG